MTTTGRTTSMPRVLTDPLRRTAFLGGSLYVLTFLASIPALFVLAPVLDDPGYIVGPGADSRVTVGAGLDVLNALACIGTAVVLYPVVKRQSQVLALGFVTTRLLEAAIIVTGVMSLLTVVTLRQDFAAGTNGLEGADPDVLVTVGAALVAFRDWSFFFGPGMAVANALLLGTLMYRSRLVPRWIPVLGLVGAPLLLAGKTATMFGLVEEFSVWTAVALPGIFVWELSLGIYLMVKGFRPSPVTAGMVADGAPRPALETVPATGTERSS
jgi:Domain of unknown function (DUF4386)